MGIPLNYLVCCAIFIGSVFSTEFIFPCGQKNVYIGYVWKNESVVHVIPKIQAKVTNSESVSGKICGFEIYNNDMLFYVKLVDEMYGFGDLRLNPNYKIEYDNRSFHVFEMAAFDCDKPPHLSQRVTVQVQIVDRPGPVFDKPHYSFKIGHHVPIGSVVGQIQAIEQLSSIASDSINTAICSYRINPPQLPFSVDNYGVIRVREMLQQTVHRPYSFRLVAEDCSRPTPHAAMVDVTVEKLMENCHPGWKNLPSIIEYRGSPDKPDRLLWPSNMELITCSGVCANALIETRLELTSTTIGHNLHTANAKSCRHDPLSLMQQQTLCALNKMTNTNLLPNPELDITRQLISPALGNTPRATAPTMVWKFEDTYKSVWQIDFDELFNGTNGNRDQFDAEFTITFWLRRFLPKVIREENDSLESDRNVEETVFCVQDPDKPDLKYLSVSIINCRFIVHLHTSLDASSNSSSSGKSTMWMFDPLPAAICTPTTHGYGSWHHYSITFSRTPSVITNQFVSILINGQDLDIRGTADEYVVNIPNDNKKPIVTVGACFDPDTHMTKQHLNGELAGLTLLHKQTESPNTLRCIAQCGESLMLPDVLKLLCPDVEIHLESDVITITGRTVEHVTNILSSIAYVRPQFGITPNYHPNLIESRILRLLTSYSCPGDQAHIIPTVEIKLNVLPLKQPGHTVELPYPFIGLNSDKLPGSSMWIPANEHLFDRATKPPPIIILGSDIVTTETPILAPGIPLFSDLRFAFPNEEVSDQINPTNQMMINSIILENCFVWPISTGSPNSLNIRPTLYEEHGSRIDWPVDEAYTYRITGNIEHPGIRINGNNTVEVYTKLLHKFRFWPPDEISNSKSYELVKHVGFDETEIMYVANIGLVCTTQNDRQNTPHFVVKVVVQQPSVDELDNLLDTNNGMNDKLKSLIDNDPVHYVHSDQERRLSNKDRLVYLKEHPDAIKSKNNVNVLLIIGLMATALVVCLIISAVICYRKLYSTDHQSPNQTNRRKRFAFKPANFGGENLKTDPTLRLTTNPINDVQMMNLQNSSNSYMDLYSTQYNQHHCIYSPPTSSDDLHRNRCSNLSLIPVPKLAELDEFADTDFDDDGEDACNGYNHDNIKSTSNNNKTNHHREYTEDADETDKTASTEFIVRRAHEISPNQNNWNNMFTPPPLTMRTTSPQFCSMILSNNEMIGEIHSPQQGDIDCKLDEQQVISNGNNLLFDHNPQYDWIDGAEEPNETIIYQSKKYMPQFPMQKNGYRMLFDPTANA